MRLRETRRGQRERSGTWRADYLETRTVGSEEGGWKRAARAVPRQPPILLVVSVGQNWPMRTPNHASCSLPISQRKCTISGIHLLNFTKGDGYCARNSHL